MEIPLQPAFRGLAHRRAAFRCLLASFALASLAAPAVARAQDSADMPVVPRERAVGDYPIEIEPHFSVDTGDVSIAAGAGAGLRISIPIVENPMRHVPNNVALTLGGDWLSYRDCRFATRCGASYLMLPVGAQWNVFAGRRVSFLLEAGAFVFKGFFDGCGPGDGPGCSAPSNFGALPMLAAGIRVHMSNDIALTARLGYPTFTLGLSFL